MWHSYPEREPVEAVVAAHLGIDPDQVLLTNGVDEAHPSALRDLPGTAETKC